MADYVIECWDRSPCYGALDQRNRPAWPAFRRSRDTPHQSRDFVKPRVSAFANFERRSHVTQAVDHSLSDPPGNRSELCEVAGIEGARQIRRQDSPQVAGEPERQHVFDFDQSLVFDFMVVFAPASPSTVARMTPLFHNHQRDVERQTWMGKDSRKVDQFVEQVEGRALLRTGSAPDDSSTGPVEFDELFADDDRLDDPHLVLFEQPSDFGADRRQTAVLDLDEFISRNDINAIAVARHLLRRRVAGVDRFELSVECGFHRP